MHLIKKSVPLIVVALLAACGDSDAPQKNDSTSKAPVEEIKANEFTLVELEKCYKDDDNCDEITINSLETNNDWVNKFLLKRISETLSEEGESKGSSTNELVKEVREKAETRHKEGYQEIKELLDDEEQSLALNYSFANEVKFKNQKNNIATIQLRTDTYTGGAHGSYHTEYFVLDLAEQKRLTLKDVLQEDGKEALGKQLVKAYKKTDNSKDNQDLWFDKDTDMAEQLWNENFYFGKKNMVFTYALYEIGPYAAGEIQLKVPYKKLTKVLREEYLP